MFYCLTDLDESTKVMSYFNHKVGITKCKRENYLLEVTRYNYVVLSHLIALAYLRFKSGFVDGHPRVLEV